MQEIHSAGAPAARNIESLSWCRKKQTVILLLHGETYSHSAAAGRNIQSLSCRREKHTVTLLLHRETYSHSAAAGRNIQSLCCCRETQTYTHLLQGKTDAHSAASGRNRKTLNWKLSCFHVYTMLVSTGYQRSQCSVNLVFTASAPRLIQAISRNAMSECVSVWMFAPPPSSLKLHYWFKSYASFAGPGK